MEYPYAISGLDPGGGIPRGGGLTLGEWAWEFLRRNPEYQRLFDRFETLPIFVTLDDGSTSNKNGKWTGTPWHDFPFFEGGACWYAEPPRSPANFGRIRQPRTGAASDAVCRLSVQAVQGGPDPRIHVCRWLPSA